MTSAAPTVLAIETDSAWVVILVVSAVTLVATLLLRRLIGAPGGLASGLLLASPLALPLVAAVAYTHAVLPEIAVWQPIGRALRDTPGDLLHLLLVADETTGIVTPYALSGSAGQWVLLVGLSVSSFMLIRRFVGTLLVSRVISRAHPLDTDRGPAIEAAIRRLSAAAGLKRVPEVLVLDSGATGAFALGLRNKRILLSRNVLDGLDPDELEATLAHEIAHLEARDVPVTFVAGLMRDLVAWNPLGHIAYRRLMQDREFEADRRAAALTRRPLAVASGLLKVCEMLQSTKHPKRFALGFLSERAGIKRRVATLLEAADGHLALGSVGHLPYAFAAVAVAILGLQVGARVAQESPAVVITWDGADAISRTWSPDESKVLRGEPPKVVVPKKRQVEQVKPSHFAPVGAAALKARDLPAWFKAMDRWTKSQRVEFIRMRWGARQNWEATPLFSQVSMGPFELYRVVPYPF